ncbi:MAG TPA: hypothetical protein ACFCUY_10450 [Xenococcaceae cyanobacterium]|jgi:hypothetical protein
MNLDEYLKKTETGDLDYSNLQVFTNKASLSPIFRLYSSYGEAKKIGFYHAESLDWILSSLQQALQSAGFTQASDLLKTDINASFASFWNKLTIESSLDSATPD